MARIIRVISTGLMVSAFSLLSANPVTDGLKKIGLGLETGIKDTGMLAGRGIKMVGEGVVKGTKKGVHGVARVTEKGASKVEGKTGD